MREKQLSKIKVEGTVVELDGDEMTRIIWQFIKDKLILPYLDVNLEYYDLGIENRDETNDQITIDAAHAIQKHGVGVKCATITPDEARVEEFGLKKMWGRPNGTIRNILGGVIFREPIIISNIPRLVPGWNKPIIIGRHAFGDQYRATDFRFAGKGTLTMQLQPDGRLRADRVRGVRRPGRRRRDGHVQPGRLDPRLRPGLAELRPGPQLPGLPVDQEHHPQGLRRPVQGHLPGGLRRPSSRTKFEAAGLTYEHRLIDDMVASALKWEGGYVWACKNYDGDVQSDTVAQGFGSLGLMTSRAVHPGRQGRRGGGRARHRHPALPPAPGRASRPRPTRSRRSTPGPAASRTAASSTATRSSSTSPTRSRTSSSRPSRAAR